MAWYKVKVVSKWCVQCGIYHIYYHKLQEDSFPSWTVNHNIMVAVLCQKANQYRNDIVTQGTCYTTSFRSSLGSIIKYSISAPDISLPWPNVNWICLLVLHSAMPMSLSHVPPSRVHTLVGIYHLPTLFHLPICPTACVASHVSVRQPQHGAWPIHVCKTERAILTKNYKSSLLA